MRSGFLYAILSLFALTTLSWTPDEGTTQTNSKKLVFQFNIKENIAPAVWRQTKQAFAEADSMHADLILIHMNTYGGTVLDADSIRTKILNSRIPIYVFIDNNAASAGALISIACDSIYMRPGSSIGAATVVNQTGQAMPDKYQSYMRSIMRSTAEAHGGDTIINGKDTTFRWFRDPKIAEAMVDQRIYIPGIIDTGKVLTFTPAEAMKYGFCEGTAENISEVLKKAGVENYELIEYKPTVLEKFIGFLVNPIVSGILIMAILGGIYFELQTPGIGFPLAVAILAGVLYFAPLYLEGLAANWEILLFIVGLILIALEIFVIPGFGVAGILGIVLSTTGLVLSMLNNFNFNFEGVSPEKILTALTTVVFALFGGFVLSIALSKKLFTANSGAFKNLSLHTVQEKSEGYVIVDASFKNLVGKEGIAFTVLRPSGKVKIDGKTYDAAANVGMIDRGEMIVVVRAESAQLYVEKV